MIDAIATQRQSDPEPFPDLVRRMRLAHILGMIDQLTGEIGAYLAQFADEDQAGALPLAMMRLRGKADHAIDVILPANRSQGAGKKRWYETKDFASVLELARL